MRRYRLPSLTNPSPGEERDRSRNICRSVNKEEGDIIDDETDVELDGYDQRDLDLDLDSEHNDGNLESNLLSDSEEFQWAPTLLE